MSFLRNTVNLLLTRAGTGALGLAGAILLARWLSVEERGQLGVLTSFTLVATLVLQLGWENSAVHALRSVGLARGLVFARSLAAGGTAAAVMVLVCALGEPVLVGRLLGEVPRAAFWLAVLGAAPQLVAQYLIGVARGIDLFGLANRYALIGSAGALLAAALALVVLDGGLLGLLAALALVQGAAAAGFALGLGLQTGVTGTARTPGPRLLGFALHSWLVNLLAALHERVDVLLLAALLPDAGQAAIYVVALGLVERLKQLPEAIGIALFPELAGREPEAAALFAARTARHSLAWLALLAAAIGAVAPWLVPALFGAPYRASVPVLWVLLPALCALSVYRILSRYYIARDAQATPIAIQAIALLLNLALNALWIPRMGALGAALASLASYGLAAAAIAVVFVRGTGTSARETFLLGRSDLDDYRRALGAR